MYASIQHLVGRELRVRQDDGSITGYWNLDESRKDLVPFFDHTGEVVEYGVWVWKYMNLEFPQEFEICLISDLLELNP